MRYFLAYFRKHGSEVDFYKLVRAGNLLQAQSIAKKWVTYPEGYVIEVTEALE
ncbi:MAG: hypothetical protein ACTSQF_09115 [Candidatus Heimdallarchaeaceae archaeon]